jgi:hypothetical protein
MDTITVSAKFAAYTWFVETACGKPPSRREAARFAEANWERFLGHADKGLGLLLIRLSRSLPVKKCRRARREAA